PGGSARMSLGTGEAAAAIDPGSNVPRDRQRPGRAPRVWRGGQAAGAVSGAAEVAAGAALDAEVAVGEGELAGDDGVGDGAADLEALEDVAVDLVPVGAGADHRAGGPVVDEQVRVGADPDRALARVEAEDLGRLGAAD